LGSPQYIPTDQYAELKAKDGLELLSSPEWVDVVNGKVMLQIAMPRQSISLLKLSW
jgi:xylan 1,4-beta-xylosidase